MKAHLLLVLSLALALAAAPAFADITLYDNGPINGSVDGWTINFGYAVTDSFTLPSEMTITGFQFGVWAYPGDTPVSVDYSLSASPFGGTPSTIALTSTFEYSNQYGYDIDQEIASWPQHCHQRRQLLVDVAECGYHPGQSALLG